MATFEIFPHFDAARGGEPDARPLTEIGTRQAATMATDLLAAGPVHGVFASPNRRCRDSVAPLAAQAGVDVQQVHGFGVPAPSGDDARDALKTAYQAGTTYAELQRIAAGKPDGRFVICSVGGDIITSLVAFVAGMNGSPTPPKLEVSIGPAGSDLRRGNVYTIVLDGNGATFSQREASSAFPQAISTPV
jgi:hypothetical protein